MNKVKGVNLGGWFVTEKWITPSLYNFGVDETSLCVGLVENGIDPTKYLAEHKRRFIRRSDFATMRRVGINSVRIPFGYWVFDNYPDHPSLRGLQPFPKGELALLKKVVGWAVAEGLGIVLDLHCAPGCQNGFDNGGIQNVCEWHTRPEYIDFTVELLGKIACEFRDVPNLSIEVLNEPRWDISTEVLKDFYIRSYTAIRQYMENEIVFHDGFRNFREFADLAVLPGVALDVHRYQCFGEDMIKMSFYEHIRHSVVDLHREAEEVMEIWPRAYVGEWSLGLNSAHVQYGSDEPEHALKREIELDIDFAMTTFAGTQAVGFAPYSGTFFWTWKTEDTPAWNYRQAAKRGWIK